MFIAAIGLGLAFSPSASAQDGRWVFEEGTAGAAIDPAVGIEIWNGYMPVVGKRNADLRASSFLLQGWTSSGGGGLGGATLLRAPSIDGWVIEAGPAWRTAILGRKAMVGTAFLFAIGEITRYETNAGSKVQVQDYGPGDVEELYGGIYGMRSILSLEVPLGESLGLVCSAGYTHFWATRWTAQAEILLKGEKQPSREKVRVYSGEADRITPYGDFDITGFSWSVGFTWRW